VLSETEFTPALQATTFVPNVYTDVTDYFERKIEIMKFYGTEIMAEPLPRSLSSIRALGRYRGSHIGVRYAEAFMLLFEKR
jgi:LmbE family N-acetylglucosaminyl deacetylase